MLAVVVFIAAFEGTFHHFSATESHKKLIKTPDYEHYVDFLYSCFK